MSRVVLVTGSRAWPEDQFWVIRKALDKADVSMLIHGGARGVDRVASEWADRHGVVEVVVPYINKLGKQGGLARNVALVRIANAMRVSGAHVHVLAFPYGEARGTRHCMQTAEIAKLPVAVFHAKKAP